MKTCLIFCFVLRCYLSDISYFAQNETSKWYFGNLAGLDFSTNPPGILNNGALISGEGCASVSDPSGNLLFYTRGDRIWDKTHQIMANGNGLIGNNSSSQSSMIVKQPGNPNIYFVFTLDHQGGPNGLHYSIVDMNLAAGNGSVTTKNILLYTPSTEKLCSVSHCNNKDVWVLSHEWNSSNFVAYLVTSSGLSSPIISTIGFTHSVIPTSTVNTNGNSVGCMKVSSDGSKLAAMITVSGIVEVFDFDNSTGIVSNPVQLANNFGFVYGCEFSPDASKLYGTVYNPGTIYQWDLCAGSTSAIIASLYTVSIPSIYIGSLQLAQNGKMYSVRQSTQTLDIINNPNFAGSACSYAPQAQSVGTATCYEGLPNFNSTYFRQKPSAFSYTSTPAPGCRAAVFASPPPIGCSASYSVLSQTWHFGDPASGANNTSSLANPTHTFSSAGTYSVKLVLNYKCHSDSLIQSVTISTTSVNVAGKLSICAGESTTLTASGATTYQWVNGPATASTVVTPTTTTVYSVTGTSSVTACQVNKTVSVSVLPCVGLAEDFNESELPKIYPNPANEVLFLETKTDVKITVVDGLGKIVDEKSYDPGKHGIDITKLKNGAYAVKLIYSDNQRVVKFLKIDTEY